MCAEACNGREAIDQALVFRPDLIVLDLSMPLMNGLDAAPRLKRLMPVVPIVMFTSFDVKVVLGLALAAGCRQWLARNHLADWLSPSVLCFLLLLEKPSIRSFLSTARQRRASLSACFSPGVPPCSGASFCRLLAIACLAGTDGNSVHATGRLLLC